MDVIRINTLEHSGLELFTRLNEAQLLHFNEPEQGLFIAETEKVIRRALEAGYQPASALVAEKHSRQATELLSGQDIPVYLCEDDRISGITGFNLNEGFLCAMKRRKLPSAQELCRGARRICVLESVVNPANIGAIFRNAAAMGIEAVLLSPACCDPLYRRAIRVSMGNVFLVPWTFVTGSEREWQEQGLDILRQMGFKTAALALRDNTLDIRDSRLSDADRLALLFGSEGNGLSDRTIERADFTVKIPMMDGVDSLNVAAASAVAFWELAMR